MKDDGEIDHGAAEKAEDKISESAREEYASQRPDAEEQAELLAQHKHHLIRQTTSKITESEEVADGMVAETEAEIPDTYCFTCEEWIGLSGVDLRGKPRSRKDAYYLEGPPSEVSEARQQVRDGLADLTEAVASTVPHVDDAQDALEFIEQEREQAEQRIAEGAR